MGLGAPGMEQCKSRGPDGYLENRPQSQGATVHPGEEWGVGLVGTWKAEVGLRIGGLLPHTCGHFPCEGCFRPLSPNLAGAGLTQEEPAARASPEPEPCP